MVVGPVPRRRGEGKGPEAVVVGSLGVIKADFAGFA